MHLLTFQMSMDCCEVERILAYGIPVIPGHCLNVAFCFDKRLQHKVVSSGGRMVQCCPEKGRVPKLAVDLHQARIALRLPGILRGGQMGGKKRPDHLQRKETQEERERARDY